MRWLFIFLVFVNLFFYIWQRQQITDDYTMSNYTAHLDDNILTIKLLSEQTTPSEPSVVNSDLVDLQEIAHSLDNSTKPITTMPNTPLTCLYLGGVTKKEQLTIFIPYLKQIDASLKPIEVELKKSPILHLYLATSSTEQQTNTLARLQVARVNTLVINRGYLKNQISLGYFTSREEIVALQKTLDELQLTYQIEDLPVTATSYWLKILNCKQKTFTSEQLLALKDQLPSMQQQLMPCRLDSH